MIHLVYLPLFFILIACGNETPTTDMANLPKPVSEQSQSTVLEAQEKQKAEARQAAEQAAKLAEEKKQAAEARVKVAVDQLKPLGIEFSTQVDFNNNNPQSRGEPQWQAVMTHPADPADPQKVMAALHEFIQARIQRDFLTSGAKEVDRGYLQLARDLHSKWVQKYTASYFAKRKESEEGLRETEKMEKELDRVGIAFKTDRDVISFSSAPRLAENGTKFSDILFAAHNYYEKTGTYLKTYGTVMPLKEKRILEIKQELIFQYAAVETQKLVNSSRGQTWKDLETLGLKESMLFQTWDLKHFQTKAKSPKEIVSKLESLSQILILGTTYFDRKLLARDYSKQNENNRDWNGPPRSTYSFDLAEEKTSPQAPDDLLNGAFFEGLQKEKLLVDDLLSRFGSSPSLESMQSELVLRSLKSLQAEAKAFEEKMKSIGWQFIGSGEKTEIDKDFRKQYELRTRFEKPKLFIDLTYHYQNDHSLADYITAYRLTQQILEYSNEPESANQRVEIDRKLALIEEILRNETPQGGRVDLLFPSK
jgi:hypothetical protein